MLHRLRTPFIAIALTVCGLAVLSPAGPALGKASARRASVAPLGGVNIGAPESAADADHSIELARQLHARVVRVELSWAELEPRGPNEIDPKALAFTDRLVSDAAAAGIGVIALVESTPCWVSSAPSPVLKKCSPTQQTSANTWPPTDLSRFAAFVGYLAGRYGTRLAAIEIWNEPDHINEAYLAGPNKARNYAALVRAAYPAIKQANPGVTVLAGSLVGSSGVFLRALYAAGIKGYYDGLAIHYYDLTLASVREIRQVQLANGDSKPLWLDEFGWSSCWPKHRIQAEQACVTPAVQAMNIASLFRSLAHTPYVAAEVIYHLQDSSDENFGLISRTGSRKPAFRALAEVLASPFGQVGGVTLSLHRRGAQVVASGSGPVGDYMGLEVVKAGVLRYRALFVLDRFNRYSITLPAVLGTSALHVRTYQYWTGRGRAAQKSI
jgi:Cellulase (glycosyl hydrolase family 5)